MAKDFTICLGTVGAGVWYSPDSGERWKRSRITLPFHAQPGEMQIRALAITPHNPHHIFAGSEVGRYRTQDKRSNWELLECPLAGPQTWSRARHPTEPAIPTATSSAPGALPSH